MTRRILQTIPADGWKAAYAIRPGQNKNNPVWVDPLACWALVEQEGVLFAVGMDSTLSFCDRGDNFLGYVSPGEKPDEWEEKALQYLQHPERHRQRGLLEIGHVLRGSLVSPTPPRGDEPQERGDETHETESWGHLLRRKWLWRSSKATRGGPN